MKSNDRDSTESLITEDEIDLREVFLLLWNNRYVISAVSFGFAFIAALVSFLILTPQYESSAVIMPSKSSGAGGLSALASQSGLGAFLNLAGGDQEVTRFVEILNSRDLAEKVLSEEQMLKFVDDPKDIPEIGTLDYRKMRERLLKGFQANTSVENQGNIIRLSFESPSPELSAETVELYLQGLQDFIERNLVTQAKRTEVFVEERLAEAEADLKQA
ncbi:MAG: Wzz/FepE/Etk N-terminal domain-containing protein, partial [Bdellovibrionota bacterium]